MSETCSGVKVFRRQNGARQHACFFHCVCRRCGRAGHVVHLSVRGVFGQGLGQRAVRRLHEKDKRTKRRTIKTGREEQESVAYYTTRLFFGRERQGKLENTLFQNQGYAHNFMSSASPSFFGCPGVDVLLVCLSVCLEDLRCSIVISPVRDQTRRSDGEQQKMDGCPEVNLEDPGRWCCQERWSPYEALWVGGGRASGLRFVGMRCTHTQPATFTQLEEAQSRKQMNATHRPCLPVVYFFARLSVSMSSGIRRGGYEVGYRHRTAAATLTLPEGDTTHPLKKARGPACTRHIFWRGKGALAGE